jgi:hypothetical protein
MLYVGSNIPVVGQHDQDEVRTYNCAPDIVELLTALFLACKVTILSQLGDGENSFRSMLFRTSRSGALVYAERS